MALGISRDALLAALRSGAPEPANRVGGRRLFSSEDLQSLSQRFAAKTKMGGSSPRNAGEDRHV